MAENEVVGIGIEARLEAFRQQMAEIPEIGGKEAKALAAQLSQEIKAAEKASKAAEKAAKDASKAQKEAGKDAASLTDRLGKADQAAKKLGGALGGIVPELAPLIEGVGAVADGAESLQAAGEAAGGGLAKVAAAAGPVVVAVAALALAYRNASRETEQLLAMRRLEAEVASSLTATERALADAKLAEAVASGAVSEGAAAETTAREAARRAVLDYAAAQAQQRAEISETIATSERNLGILRSTIKAGLIVAALPALPVLIADAAIEGVDKARERLDAFASTLAGGIDSVIGWGDSIDDGRARLAVLDRAVQRQADLQSELRTTTTRTAAATRTATEGTKAAEEAERRRAEAVALLQEQLSRQGAAVEALRQIEATATADQLSELDRLTAERDAALAAITAREKESLDARLGDAAALAEADEAADKARRAVEERYQRDVGALRTKEKEAADKARAEAVKADEAAAAARKAIQERLIGYGQQALSQLAAGLDEAAATSAARAEALTGKLAALDQYLTTAQREQLRARIEASEAAARRAFAVAKAGKIAEATVNTFTAATAALASAPPPFNFVAAGLVTASGLANVATIAAQQPAFHSGGAVDLAPDEGLRRLRDREFVANPTGRAVLGDRALEAANAGIAPGGGGGAVVVQVYRHTRQVDRYEADRLAAGNPVARELMKNRRPGMEG